MLEHASNNTKKKTHFCVIYSFPIVHQIITFHRHCQLFSQGGRGEKKGTSRRLLCQKHYAHAINLTTAQNDFIPAMKVGTIELITAHNNLINEFCFCYLLRLLFNFLTCMKWDSCKLLWRCMKLFFASVFYTFDIREILIYITYACINICIYMYKYVFFANFFYSYYNM